MIRREPAAAQLDYGPSPYMTLYMYSSKNPAAAAVAGGALMVMDP